MNPPNGLGIKIYLTLIKLFADQNNVQVKGEFEVGGVKVKYDTNDPILSYEEIVRRYGLTNSERKREADNAEIEKKST